MANEQTWALLSFARRQERQKELQQLESDAQDSTLAAQYAISLLKDFTKEIGDQFVVPKACTWLAAMLAANLNALAGPQSQCLKVKEPEKLHFQPRKLLSDVLQIYINLCERIEFVNAVAKEEIVSRKALFLQAIDIVRRRAIMIEADIEKLNSFLLKVETARITMGNQWNDAPVEFFGV